MKFPGFVCLTLCSFATLLLAEQPSGLNFAPVAVYNPSGHFATSVAIADVNGDGKLDLVVANQCASSINCNSATVGVMVGNGDGIFQSAVTYPSGGADA